MPDDIPGPDQSGTVPAALMAELTEKAAKIERFAAISRMVRDLPGWMLHKLQTNPLSIAVTIAGGLSMSVWLVETGLPKYANIKAEQYPFFTQSQGQNLTCMVTQTHWMSCDLARRSGGLIPGDCEDLSDSPEDCS